MLERLHNQVGTAGLVVAIVALVAALGGGAYAATGGSAGGKATASAKGKPGPRGKTGKTGPQGPAGPQGSAGPAGPKGDTGAAGSSGSNGTGVTGTTVPAGQEGCAAGGVKYTSASGTNVVCNGKNGINGTSGFTETLPGGKTETGAWALGEVSAGAVPSGTLNLPISFAIPLAAELTSSGCNTNPPPVSCHTHYINESGNEVLNSAGVEMTSTACLGTAAAPSAEPGNLCIYAGPTTASVKASNLSVFKAHEEDFGASTAGAVIRFTVAEGALSSGTWAVTAEEE